jgi:hypothetical protein
MTTEPAIVGEGITYTYRPSLMGAPWQFQLSDRGLEWSAGRHSGVTAFEKIQRVRMSFKPTNMQQRRFMTEIWADGCPKLPIVSSSWKSVFEQEALDRPYVDFITELHRRMAQAGAAAQYNKGGNPLIVWAGFAVFSAVTLGMAWLVVRALQEGAQGGAVFIVAFIALFVWRGWNFFRRNWPGVYRPDALPELLLPKLAGQKP